MTKAFAVLLCALAIGATAGCGQSVQEKIESCHKRALEGDQEVLEACREELREMQKE